MENIWGSQRKTANMERGGLREENRRAHEEDERFRITAVKAAGPGASAYAQRDRGVG